MFCCQELRNISATILIGDEGRTSGLRLGKGQLEKLKPAAVGVAIGSFSDVLRSFSFGPNNPWLDSTVLVLECVVNGTLCCCRCRSILLDRPRPCAKCLRGISLLSTALGSL